MRVHGIVDPTRLGSGSDVRGAIELGLGRRDKLLPVIAEKYSDSGVEGRQGVHFVGAKPSSIVAAIAVNLSALVSTFPNLPSALR